MKKTQLILVIITSFYLCSSLQAQVIFEYEESYSAQTENIPLPIAPKSDELRLKSSGGAIFKTELTGFTSEQKIALDYALALWAEQLPLSDEVIVKAQFGKMAADKAYTVAVVANKGRDTLHFNSQAYYPSALLVQGNIVQRSSEVNYDLSITFNSDMEKWHFGTNAEQSLPVGKTDFVTTTLRAMAKGLGFASDLAGKEGGILFEVDQPYTYLFNQHVRNSANDRLSNQSEGTLQLNSYVKSGDLYWDRPNYSDYKLYAPTDKYDKTTTLNYFDTDAASTPEKALMAPDCPGVVHHIGEKVLDVLEDIGWTNPIGLQIKSDQISENGLINYDPSTAYRFYNSTSIGNFTPEWSFDIQNKDGSYENISSGSSATFSIQLPSVMKDSYYRVSSGQLKGRVRLKASLSTGKVLESSFFIHINYAPEKPQIVILEILPQDEICYIVKLGIYARGAEVYTLHVSEEFSPGIVAIPIDQSGYVAYELSYNYYDSQMDYTVKASNKYGVSVPTSISHFESSDGASNDPVISIVDDQIQLKNGYFSSELSNVKLIRIIDFKGNVIKTVSNQTSISIAGLEKGFYILYIQDNKGNIYSRKFVK